ncbi:MAG: heavy metal translocating P-type ATPase [Candidatus Saccharibacteria bacterium]
MINLKNNFIKNYGWLSFVSLGLAISFSLYLTGYVRASEWILIVLCGIGIIPEIVSIVKDLLSKKFGVDLIAVVAILASLVLKEYAAAGVILLMFTGGAALEQYAKARAQKELSSLLRRAPRIAHVLRGGDFINVSVDKVEPRDVLLVKPGETVPVDAVIIKGQSSFDESAITGESMPLDKKKNDEILSGTINQDSPVEIRALRSSAKSQYEQIVLLVKSAASSKSPMVRLADAYSIPFTLIAFGLSAAAWLLSGDPIRALSVLVVATPCPLLIATPVAIVSGMSRAARDGIIIKDGVSLEKLAILQALAFDKTGTLTQNKPTITAITPYGITKKQLLSLAASLEVESTHALAGIVVNEARRQKLKLHKTTQLHEILGGGIRAVVNADDVYIGKLDFLKNNGTTIPASLKNIEATAIYVARNKKFLGVIELSDPVRTNASSTLSKLRSLGITKTLILTGDKLSVARTIAQKIGITDIHASLLPADKLDIIKDHSKRGEVIGMVGDGVNDAPVLAASDVGIALGAKGSTAASESADVVIMLDDISRVADAVSIAKRSVNIAKQSIFIGIGLSIILMIFASLGDISPLYGALLQELVDVAVIINALRAHGGKIAKL